MFKVQELIRQAMEARESAYAPYSGYKVGAALLTKSGKIYRGCNIECAAYSVGICAERTAISKAVSDGDCLFDSIAVVGGKELEEVPSEFAPPCGMCRQLLREFGEPNEMRVILAKNEDVYRIYTLEELLPYSFGPNHL